MIELCAVHEMFKGGNGWFHRDSSSIDKVCFLTVQESFVENGASQRRPGVHVDCPGSVKFVNYGRVDDDEEGSELQRRSAEGTFICAPGL